MRTSILYCVLAALLPIVVTSSGCGHAVESKAATSAPAEVSAAVVRVTTGAPQRKTLVVKTVQPARIEAFEDTPVFSKLAGYVEKVHVDIGDNVVRDQPLVTLRVPELIDDVRQKTAFVTQAEAQLKQAAVNIDAAKAAVDTADAKVAEAHAGMTRADGECQRWKSEYGRIKQLAANGSVTEKLSDETLNQLRAAEASCEAATAAIKSAEAAAREAKVNVEKAEADRAAAEARLGVATADLAHANTMLDYATIRAPFDGVVTNRSVDTGHFVQPAASGATPILVVARIDKVRVYIEIPEMEAAAVSVGDTATIGIQAMPGKTIASKVVRTSWSLDPSNRSLRAEVDVDNRESMLRPGMYAIGTIELQRQDNALVVPVSATIHKDDGNYICCVESGKVNLRPVELGLRSGPEIQVQNGIDEKSAVVLMRGDSLKQGQAVEVVGHL